MGVFVSWLYNGKSLPVRRYKEKSLQYRGPGRRYNSSKRAPPAEAMVKNKCQVEIPSLLDFQTSSGYERYSAIN